MKTVKSALPGRGRGGDKKAEHGACEGSTDSHVTVAPCHCVSTQTHGT